MQELLIATKNPGKYREIAEALNGLPFRLVFLKDLSVEDADFVEDGETFSENAYKKAKYYFGKTGLPTLAEDSGIVVDSLSGELGVKTRRWGAGELASDEEWIEFFMRRMADVSERTAKFICSACLLTDEEPLFFEGETRGEITKELLVPLTAGIPLSSCFLPEGLDRVYAALTPEEKNRISHRGKAMGQVRSYLSMWEL